MKKIIFEISKTSTPSKIVNQRKREIGKLAHDLVKREIGKYSETTGLEFGGSFAKNTWLSQDADIDIFIKFEKTVSIEKFENISRKIGFDALKKYSPYIRYSQHPFVEAKIKDTKINVVPFYDVNVGEWRSAADRSPFHTRFMKKALTSKMRNEVRILKMFLKANKIYGAEIARQGFSGYISEVLITEFGSFENLVKSISKIDEKEIIGKTSRKFDTSIVVIDPVDDNRNLAAAISDENIGKFVLVCRAFREKPSLAFFKYKRTRIAKKYWDNLLVVKFDFKPRSPDIIWGQIKRATSTITTQLELGGFRVLRKKSYTDEKSEACLLFFLESTKINKIYQKEGPEFFRDSNSKSFILKNLKDTELMWIGHNKKIISLEKRKHTDVVNFTKELLKNNIHTCIPNGLQRDFKCGFKVFIGNKNLSKSIKEAANELISTDGAFLHSN